MTSKKNALPVVRTPAQVAALEAQARREEEAAEKAALQAHAQQLAQIANLLIGGYTFEEIGVSIGATADEVESMMSANATRFIRSQPQLRVFIRNWANKKYNGLLDSVYDQAVDVNHKEQLEYQDRALRVINNVVKMNGAEMPVQKEVKIEGAPEQVERMVAALAAATGGAYDASVFDVVDAEIVHESAAAEFPETEDQDEPEDSEWDAL